MTRSCIFLDRDGVINKDTGYVSEWKHFEFIPGAIGAMKDLSDAGYLLAIITNQSGIARGYYSLEDYQLLTEQILHSLQTAGIKVLGVYYCPHHPAGIVQKFSVQCNCRKPAPGMILRAAIDHDLELASSIFVGDKLSDMQAAFAAGIGQRYLVGASESISETDRALITGEYVDLADWVRVHKTFSAGLSPRQS
jgi:D-glycero-D-manno-heptose 1,7-bisphosphate phosphatase